MRSGVPANLLILIIFQNAHNLADEARLKMPPSVTVALWQGRKAFKAGADEPMCRNLDAVDAAIKIGADGPNIALKGGPVW